MRPRELVQAWVDAFNDRHVGKLAGFYSEDAINHQVTEGPVQGRHAIRTMFIDAFSLAEMICIPENIFGDRDWAILEWRDPLGLRGCGFFDIVDGIIVLQRGYWDKLSFLKRHGLPIPQEPE